MKKKSKKGLGIATFFGVAFFIWTVLIFFIDVQPIGPQESTVGFSTINRRIHELTGVNMLLYTITDWLGLVPIGVALGFATLGVAQWIKRKSLWNVDRSILILGIFYIAVMAVYVLFEVFVVNSRPVLIEGVLEASYPSSTTMLVMCVMPTAMMQFCHRIKHRAFRRFVVIAIAIFVVFMVVGRLLSGVHWVTDIIGGALISSGLVMMYRWVVYGR